MIHERLVIIPCDDHILVDPMPDVGHVGQITSQATFGCTQHPSNLGAVFKGRAELEAFWQQVRIMFGEERAVFFNVGSGVLYAAVVFLEELEIGTNDFGIRLEGDIFAIIGGLPQRSETEKQLACFGDDASEAVA